MGSDDGVEGVLATLPDGARVLSTLLTSQTPPQHVYRVMSSSGQVLAECSTLTELNEFVRHYSAQAPTDREP